MGERHGQALATVLERHAAGRGDEPSLLFEPEPGKVETTTWVQALDRAQRAAGVLTSRGVRAGDRFNIHLTNRPEFYDRSGCARAPAWPG